MLTEQTVLEFVIPGRESEAKAVLASRVSEQRLSVPLKILLGLGAFISSLFFMTGFVTLAKVTGGKVLFVAAGICAMIFAILAQMLIKKISSIPLRFFCEQTLLIAMLFGRSSILYGTFSGMPQAHFVDTWLAIAFLLMIIPYMLFRDPVDRFISVFVFMSILYLRANISGAFMVNTDIIFISFMVSAFLFMTRKRLYAPVAWAVAVSMIIPFFIGLAFGGGYNRISYSAVVFNQYKLLLIFCYSLVFGAYAFVNKYYDKKFLAVPAIIFVLMLPFNLPIIYGLTYMVIGQYYRDMKIRVLSYAMLCGGIIFLYYNLDITLLNKSILLILSGATLLGIRAFLQRFKYEI